MTREELELSYISGLKREEYPKRILGGQSCGMPIRGIKLIHEELGFEVAVSEHRSQIKNYDLALDLFRLYLSATIKM